MALQVWRSCAKTCMWTLLIARLARCSFNAHDLLLLTTVAFQVLLLAWKMGAQRMGFFSRSEFQQGAQVSCNAARTASMPSSLPHQKPACPRTMLLLLAVKQPLCMTASDTAGLQNVLANLQHGCCAGLRILAAHDVASLKAALDQLAMRVGNDPESFQDFYQFAFKFCLTVSMQ